MPNPDPQYDAWGWDPITSSRDLVMIEICGRFPRVRPEAVAVFEAMNQALIDTGYEDPCDYVGSWNYRVVAGTNQLSRHSYGLAIDLDYGGDTDGDGDPTIDKNPHLYDAISRGDSRFTVTFQLSENQVDAIESIRTGNGKQALRWLGWVNGDTMHFDVNVSPQDLATGIVYEPGGSTMALERWVTRLRTTDITQMGHIGVLTADEVGYWRDTKLAAVQAGAAVDAEWQDLRDAVEVRSQLWV